jgi:type IV pilus modification protein PilV
MKKYSRKRNTGFSLIEVLIAVVIMSVGLLALASLQMSLIRSSSETKAQSVALALGKQQLEDLRSFTTMAEYAANIVDSTPADITESGVTYGFTVTVDHYAFDGTDFQLVADNATESTLSAAGYVLGRDYKDVTVVVDWTDAAGNAQTVTLDDLIDGLNPADSARVAKNTSGTSKRNVQIIISDPSKEAGVIPIAIGDGSDTAATNPKPEVGGKDGTTTLETRFDIYTYAALNDGNALAQARVETLVVGCTCDTTQADTERGYRPTYWNGYRYVAPTLATYDPPAGAADLGNNDVAQSTYCDVCCRDHHDTISGVTITGAKFDPWREDHVHYVERADAGDEFVKVGDGSTQYMEACRLIRVDGIFRVAADLNDEYFNLLETQNDGSDTEYVPTDTATANYQALVLAYLDEKVVNNDDDDTYNDELSSSDVATLEGKYSINDPSSIDLDREEVTSGSHKWLHSRGLYIDYLESSAKQAIEDAKDDCETNSCDEDALRTAVLKVLPFTSINLTEISNWSPTSSDDAAVAVSDDSFATAYSSDSPVRGYVTPGSGLGEDATNQDARTEILKSTSGLQVRFDLPIDEEENADGQSDFDTQTFAIAKSDGSGSGVAGNVSVYFGDYDYEDNAYTTPQVAGTYLTNCGAGKKNSNSASCDISALGSAVKFTISDYNYLNSDFIGYTFDNSCTHSGGTESPKSYTTVSGDGLKQCIYQQITGVSSSRGSAVIGSLSRSNENNLTETTSFEVNPVGDSGTPSTEDVISLTFSDATNKDPSGIAPTCTFTCSKSPCSKSGNKVTYTINNNSSTCD